MYSFTLYAQSSPVHDSYYSVSEHSYGIKEGMPDLNVTQMFLDNAGKLHLSTIGGYKTAFGEDYYEYDGIRAYNSQLNNLPNGREFIIKGKDEQGRFYGVSYNDSEDNSFLWYDPINKAIHDIKMGDDKVIAKVTMSVDGELYALTKPDQDNQVEILHITEEKINSIFTLELAAYNTRFLHLSLAASKSNFWVTASSRSIIKVNRNDGAIERYTIAGEETIILNSHISSNNDIWFSGIQKNAARENSMIPKLIYHWDNKKESFNLNPYKPIEWKENEIVAAHLFIDSKRNILVSYQNLEKEINATLIDSNQTISDYSSVMSDHNRVLSYDFRKEAIFYQPGLRFVEVSAMNAIIKNKNVGQPRHMLELNSNEILFPSVGILNISDNVLKKEDATEAFLSKTNIGINDVAIDHNGDIWFSNKGKFLKYSFKTELCDTIHSIDTGHRFDFLNTEEVVFISKENVYIWNELSKKVRLLTESAYEKDLNQLFIGAEGNIWLAHKDGLFQIDPETGKKKWIDLIPNQSVNVMRIHQNKNGMLWLGTVMNGIIIFDPQTGHIKIVDDTQGLSNNIVVSLLEDDDGDIWAGTFFGISVLSKEGRVIGRLFEEDGLMNNECNRWSSMKMKDGRLCFGAINGVSIIDPSLWKLANEGHSVPGIYLTEVYSITEDLVSDRTDYLDLINKKERIVFPATTRNLNISFGLSNYSTPDKNTFAYKLQGIDNDWNFIGSQRKLTLNNLPSGKYNIVLKGANARGEWSESNVVIPIHVNEYFYKQWWFYLVCSLPFLGFLVLWQIRQNGERERLELEVKNRTAIIQEQSGKLLELDKAKSRFFANISHEFRTPLTLILGPVRKALKKSKRLDNLSMNLIERNGQRLLELINQILDLSKLEDNKMQIFYVRGDIIALVKSIVDSFQVFAQDNNINLSFRSEVKELEIDYDKQKIHDIISNLLSNALKFSSEGDIVDVEFKCPKNDQFSIQVTDSGIGISSTDLPFLFDRFHQVYGTESSSRIKGSGIGLSLIKQLIELMGGSIDVKSKLGEGSQFTCLLPIRLEASQKDNNLNFNVLSSQTLVSKTSDQSPKNPITNESDNDNRIHILIIEDTEELAHYIASCLPDHYKVSLAENGQLGIDKALTDIPDIIISDVMMPEKDGFEVCETLKNNELTSHIPIILLTAMAEVEARIKGLKRGADAYIAKPFDEEELQVRVTSLIDLRKKLQIRFSQLATNPKIAFEKSEKENPEFSLENDFILKMRSVLMNSYKNPLFDVGKLNQAIGMSEAQLRRKSKALMGCSPNVYIRDFRLTIAKELLLETDQNISEVSYQVGFNDPSYFARVFQKSIGLSPTLFRARSFDN